MAGERRISGKKEKMKLSLCTKRFLPVDNSLIEVIITLTEPGWKDESVHKHVPFCVSITIRR
jgi:hypothetical protein